MAKIGREQEPVASPKVAVKAPKVETEEERLAAEAFNEQELGKGRGQREVHEGPNVNHRRGAEGGN